MSSKGRNFMKVVQFVETLLYKYLFKKTSELMASSKRIIMFEKECILSINLFITFISLRFAIY